MPEDRGFNTFQLRALAKLLSPNKVYFKLKSYAFCKNLHPFRLERQEPGTAAVNQRNPGESVAAHSVTRENKRHLHRFRKRLC